MVPTFADNKFTKTHEKSWANYGGEDVTSEWKHLAYLHFKEGAAKRGPAVHRLQKGPFGLLHGHTSLFVVGGNDKLRITHISAHKYR